MKSKKIEDWSDERGYGNGIIVTLNYGWCFDDPYCHVKGFDDVREAKEAVRYSIPCKCNECIEETK